MFTKSSMINSPHFVLSYHFFRSTNSDENNFVASIAYEQALRQISYNDVKMVASFQSNGLRLESYIAVPISPHFPHT